MANTFTWKINKMDVISNLNNLTNFVTRVYWEYIGVDETNTYTSSITGYVEFDNNNNEENYINYSDLTESEVIDWIEPRCDIFELQNIINDKISDLIEPKIINLPIPWIKVPEVQNIDTNNNVIDNVTTENTDLNNNNVIGISDPNVDQNDLPITV